MEVGPMRTHTHFQGAFKVLLLSSSPKYFSKWNSRTGKKTTKAPSIFVKD